MLVNNTVINRLKAIGAVAACTAIIGVSANTVGAQPNYSTSNQVNLAPGTVIPVILNSELTSNDNTNGDTFTATVDTSKQAYNSMMQGATVEGTVNEAVPQSGNNPGTLALSFTKLTLPNGQSYPISGTAVNLDNSIVTTGPNGIMTAKATVKDQSLKYAGIGAGAGVLIGILGHGKLNLTDALIGGLLGYGAGALTKAQQQGQVHDVDLKPGTTMGVMLNNRVHYYRHTNYTTTNDVVTPVVTSGVKYYWYNGQKWMLDTATGTRAIVSNTAPIQQPAQFNHQSRFKYYTYQGHPFRLNLDTGARTQLD